MKPRTEEIGLRINTTENLKQVFVGVSVHIKHIFLGVPKISKWVSREQMESPSLKRVAGKTGKSRDPNIFSLVFFVRGDTDFP